MGKDQDLIQVVKDRDIGALQKILVKMKPGKQGKTKLLGSTKRGNINFQDADGMSALHQAALMGNLDMMQLLLEHGAQVNIQDNKGMLALHYAAWQGKSEPVHVLLQWKAPVNMQAQEQITPLHLACQHGHFDVVNLLLLHHANPTLYNKDFKTALDLACEFGHYRVVDLLLRSNLCAPLLVDSPSDMIDNNRTTCLHLAAKNGHVEIIRLLLQAGVNINRCTLRGTSLHEAALCGKLDVVKLLIDRGIDVNKANSYDQTALDIVTTYTATKGARELKHILKEASFAVKARAIKDYNNTYDSEALTFKEGDIIKVLERKEDVWKGIVVSDTRRMSKPGYFPADHVILLDNADYHSHHHPHQPSNQNQKLAYHQDHHTHQHTNSHLPPPHPNHQHHHLHQHQHPQQHYGHYHSHNGALHLTGQQQQHHSSPTPYPLYNSVQDVQNVNGHQYISHVGDHIIHHHNNSHHGDWSNLSPYSGVSDIRSNGSTKDSPTNSNRNSAASSDSGRGYSTTGHLEPKVQHNYANVQITNQHRLSGQSYESGVSSRQSYHSTSSSSVGSLDRLEESGYSSQVNVAELFQAGLPDHEVIRCWLRDLRFEDYHGNFIQAGYDMPTISRMTPEDLTAIGITKPGHRKKLKAEIARLNIHDGIPEHKPGSVVEWLHLLNLNQYSTTLTKQGYDTIDSLTDITWEDLEEIGIQKLGHQKKIMLAIERLKRLNSGAKRMSTMDSSKRSSGEALEPPISNNNSRWSGSSGGGGQMMSSSYNGQDVAGGIPYKSRHASAEIINNNMSGIEYMMGSPVRNRLSSDGNMDLSYPPPSPGYQPDLVPIQVKRSSSGSGKYSKETKDMAGQTITYQSFQVPPGGHRISDPMDRESTPTGDMYQMSSSPVPVAPVAPKAVIKPQPVATIVAKTRRSSREYSPDIIDIEKHEFEKNQDNILRSPTHNSFMKPKSEVIYDTPRLNSPLSPIQRSHDFCTPVKTVVSVHHSNPSEPLFIATHASSQHQEVCYPSPPQGSPSSRSKKVPPPPPPKRTNSISQKSDLGLCSPKPQHTPIALVKAGVQTPQSVRREDNNTAPQQQAFAACVQSLSEKLGKKRHESVNDCDTGSSDSEDLPPPPPPLAMDIITPKLHNYGIPTKEEKSSMGSEYRMQSVAKHHEQQQLQQAKHFEQHSVQNQIHQHAMSPSRGIPQHQHHSQLPHSPHHNAMGSFSVGQSPAVLSGQATGAHYQRQNSNNHLKEQQNSAPNTPKKQVQSVEPSLHHQTRVSNKGSVQSPSHSFKAQHEVKGKAASPPGGEDKMTVENTFGVKLRSSAQIQNTSVSVTASVVPSAPPQVAPKSLAATSVSSGAPKQVFHSVKTAQQASETAAITTNVPKTKNSEVSQPLNSFQKPPNAAVDGARGKRKDSSSSLDLNTSTTSIDSNTLPFANENVGTIKQRTPTSKPSIALGSDDAHAAEKANLSAHLYSQGHDGSAASCVARTQTVSSGSRPVACAQESKPTVPKKPSTKNKSGKNEDVLSDIDNMLQGLTNELDAMLEEEEMLALNKS